MVDNRDVGTADIHEEQVESRYEAAGGVGLVLVMQVTLALVSLEAGWTLNGLPGWVCPLSASVEQHAQGSSLSFLPSRERRPYWSGIHPQPQIATGAGGVMP